MDMLASKRKIWPSVALLLLASCQSYSPDPIDKRPELARHLQDLDLGSGPNSIDPARPLTLDAVAMLAARNNPDLKAARAERGVAQAQVLLAGILSNPSLNASYAFLLGGPATVGAIAASLGQDVKSLVTLSAKRSTAVAAAESVDASLLWQEWQTIGKARLLVVDLLAGEQQRRLLTRTQEVLKDRLGREQHALAQGNATLTTLVPALSAVADLQKQIDDLARQQQTRRHDLDALLGLTPDVALTLDARLDLPAINPAAVAAGLATLADRRPDLIALQLGYRSQEEKLRAAVLAQFPALVMGATGGRDTSDVRSLGPQITMDLPVFDRNQGNIAVEQATRQKLHDEFTARLKAAKGEVQAMLADQTLIAGQLDALRAEVRTLDAAAARGEAAYRAGNIDARSYVDLITTALAKEQELAAREQIEREQQVAIATLVGAGMPLASLPQIEVSR
jgi:outer membrane protein TolC